MSSPNDQNKPSDIVARSSGLPPNTIRGSGVISREQLYIERQQQIRLNAERQKTLEQQRKAAAAQRKRSGGGSIPSWLSASRAKKKKADQEAAAAEEKAAKKAQKKAEREAVFEAFRSADTKAQAEGKDLTKASFRVSKDTKTVNELKAEGIDISSLGKDVKGKTEVTVSSIKGSGFKGVLYGSEAKSNKQGRSGKDLQYEYTNPNYNIKFGSKRIGDIVSSEAAKGDKGIYGSRARYDPKEVSEFIAGYSFYEDVKRGKGASDDVYYSPKAGLLGKAGVYEGKDDFGFYRTMTIKQTLLPKTVEAPLTRAEQVAKQVPDDPFEGLKNTYANIYTGFLEPAFKGSGIGIGAIFTTLSGNKEGTKELIKQTKQIGDYSIKLDKPDISSEFVSEYAIKSFINQNSNKNLYDFSQTLATRPKYFAGSIAAEASLWVNPFTLPFKVANVASKAPVWISKATKFGGLIGDIGRAEKATSGFKNSGKIGSLDVFEAIQKQRSPTSVYKNWIDDTRTTDVRSLARQFDQANPPSIGRFKPESFGLDEVRITREFENAPKEFRFLEEKRPAVFGQKEALTIDEELGLTKLSTSKPRSKVLKPSDVIKSDLFKITDVKATGAPFKLTDESRLPKLGNIMKSDLWKGTAVKATGAPFKFDSAKLPKLSDILRSDVAGLGISEKEARIGEIGRAERSVFSTVTPSGKKVKKLSDILRSDVAGLGISEKEARIGEIGRAERSVLPNLTPSGKKVKKLSDILKPNLFKGRKSKGGKSLSEKELADLFETLEGKKEIGTARDLLSRNEQGRLSGDLLEDLTPKKAASDARKITDDLLKPAKKAKKKDSDVSAIEKALGGSSGQSAIVITKTRAASGSSGGIPELEFLPTPAGYSKPASKGFNLGLSSLLSAGILGATGSRKGSKSIERIATIPKVDLFKGSAGKNALRFNLSEILSSNVGLSTRLTGRQATRIETGQRRATKVNLDFGFKFDTSLKPISTTGQKYRFTPFNDTPTPSKITPRLDIPTITRTPPKTPKLELPKGFLKASRSRSAKGKGRSQRRTFLVPSLPIAFLGTNSKFAKDFEKKYGKLY